jgi:hypothetical protein
MLGQRFTLIEPVLSKHIPSIPAKHFMTVSSSLKNVTSIARRRFFVAYGDLQVNVNRGRAPSLFFLLYLSWGCSRLDVIRSFMIQVFLVATTIRSWTLVPADEDGLFRLWIVQAFLWFPDEVVLEKGRRWICSASEIAAMEYLLTPSI